MEMQLRLTNGHAHEVRLILEPWGDVHVMPPGSTREIVFEVSSDEGRDAPEIVYEPESITIYAGRSGMLRLSDEPRPVLNGARKAVVVQVGNTANQPASEARAAG